MLYHCATSFFPPGDFRDFLTYGDLNTVIGEDEGGVGSGELGGRHCDIMESCRRKCRYKDQEFTKDKMYSFEAVVRFDS